MHPIARVGLLRAAVRAPFVSVSARRWNTTSPSGGQQQQPPKQDNTPETRSLLERLRNMQGEVGGFVSSAESNFAKAGVVLNRMTGYDEIQLLKRTVIANEQDIAHARQAARAAKDNHDTAAKARAASQREVNDLLSRKATWSETDVVRFTSLVREDHVLDQAERTAAAAVVQAEAAVEKALSALTNSILARYHEEQVWSDKIRQISTYGQLGVMAVNVLVFIIAIVIVEPWKRKRLGETFEKRVEELEKEHRALFEQNSAFVRSTLESQGKLLQTLAVTDEPLSADDMDNELAVREVVTAAQQITDRRRRSERLETIALSSLGGALGVGVASLIISIIRG